MKGGMLLKRLVNTAWGNLTPAQHPRTPLRASSECKVRKVAAANAMCIRGRAFGDVLLMQVDQLLFARRL